MGSGGGRRGSYRVGANGSREGRGANVELFLVLDRVTILRLNAELGPIHRLPSDQLPQDVVLARVRRGEVRARRQVGGLVSGLRALLRNESKNVLLVLEGLRTTCDGVKVSHHQPGLLAVSGIGLGLASLLATGGDGAYLLALREGATAWSGVVHALALVGRNGQPLGRVETLLTSLQLGRAALLLPMRPGPDRGFWTRKALQQQRGTGLLKGSDQHVITQVGLLRGGNDLDQDGKGDLGVKDLTGVLVGNVSRQLLHQDGVRVSHHGVRGSESAHGHQQRLKDGQVGGTLLGLDLGLAERGFGPTHLTLDLLLGLAMDHRGELQRLALDLVRKRVRPELGVTTLGEGVSVRGVLPPRPAIGQENEGHQSVKAGVHHGALGRVL